MTKSPQIQNSSRIERKILIVIRFSTLLKTTLSNWIVLYNRIDKFIHFLLLHLCHFNFRITIKCAICKLKKKIIIFSPFCIADVFSISKWWKTTGGFNGLRCKVVRRKIHLPVSGSAAAQCIPKHRNVFNYTNWNECW